jgi:hypothetical protein
MGGDNTAGMKKKIREKGKYNGYYGNTKLNKFYFIIK